MHTKKETYARNPGKFNLHSIHIYRSRLEEVLVIIEAKKTYVQQNYDHLWFQIVAIQVVVVCQNLVIVLRGGVGKQKSSRLYVILDHWLYGYCGGRGNVG